MTKESILSQIASKLSQMGIPYQEGGGTDIAVFSEFLKAGWSTGSKKITYEASIFADETSNTVFMWEKTSEAGHGLSFGGESGSSFQSGRTLFRKVKSIQYGPEGKVYEYTLDLGAVPKAVKEAAVQHGWKFKTVLRRGKASWPAGFAQTVMNAKTAQQSFGAFQREQPQGGSFCTNCGMELAPDALFCPGCGTKKQGDGFQQQDEYAWQNGNVQQHRQINYQPEQPYAAQPPGQQNYNPHSDPQRPSQANARQKVGAKGGILGLIGLILIGVLVIVMLAATKATLTGWAISAVVFAAAISLQRILSRKGCLPHLALCIAAGLILLAVMSLTATDTASFTTAKLKNAHMATAIDNGGKPADNVSSYPVTAPELVAVAELRNAPPKTKVRFVWTYVTGNMPITEYSMDSGESGANIYVFSNLTNDKPWPEGDYKVEMYVEDRKMPDAVVNFTVGTKRASR